MIAEQPSLSNLGRSGGLGVGLHDLPNGFVTKAEAALGDHGSDLAERDNRDAHVNHVANHLLLGGVD
jgi:hypothetical protein